MMKNSITSLLFLITISTFAQNLSKDEVINKMTDDVCECVESQKDKIKKLTGTDLEMQLGFCILKAYGNYKTEYAEVSGELDFEDNKIMVQLGEEIGIAMASRCTETLMVFAGNVVDDNENVEDRESNIEEFVIQGTVLNIANKQFKEVEIKDITGRKHKLLWLTYVGGTEILESSGKKIKEEVVIEFYEQELFDTSINEYRKFKVISKISYK